MGRFTSKKHPYHSCHDRHQIAHWGWKAIAIWCLNNTTTEKVESYATVVPTICCWKQFLINMAQVVHLRLR